MYMIEITENKMGELVENVEKCLRYGGKAMACLDSLQRGEGRYGERSPMPDYRDDWRYENERREHDMYDDDDDGRYGERRSGYRGRRRY